jgi:phosphoglycolate phosphatase
VTIPPGAPRCAGQTHLVAVVGFDLDMTLVDSRPGIATSLTALAAETGAHLDVDVIVGRLGARLEDELACWYPRDEVPAVADRYRALYADLGVPGTVLLPGAADAVAAVRADGGRAVVITAKYEPNAWACLRHVGLAVDEVVGWRWGPEKGGALSEHGAAVYVGDTPDDVAGAHAASVLAVAVPTGPHDAAALRAAGADVVLGSLTEFPAWYAAWAVTAR